MMQNTGQLYAYDADRHQLKPIFDRIKRAGVRNVQVLRAGDEAALEALGPRFDMVLADAPCTGSGTWRRRPDAKWRLKPEALAARQAEQRMVLARGASLVKPGGRLVYVTCSILPEENTEQIAGFLKVAAISRSSRPRRLGPRPLCQATRPLRRTAEPTRSSSRPRATAPMGSSSPSWRALPDPMFLWMEVFLHRRRKASGAATPARHRRMILRHFFRDVDSGNKN